jgi:hypothetical protein
MRKKVYIAGKVTGEDPEQCIRKFAKMEESLSQNPDYEVINPMKIAGPEIEWKLAMRKCIAALMECDNIVFLQDWFFSDGAVLEHYIASQIGITEIKIYGNQS